MESLAGAGKTLAVLPSREKLRRLVELPRWRKSSTLRLLLKRERPNTATAEPQRPRKARRACIRCYLG